MSIPSFTTAIDWPSGEILTGAMVLPESCIVNKRVAGWGLQSLSDEIERRCQDRSDNATRDRPSHGRAGVRARFLQGGFECEF